MARIHSALAPVLPLALASALSEGQVQAEPQSPLPLPPGLPWAGP